VVLFEIIKTLKDELFCRDVVIILAPDVPKLLLSINYAVHLA